jgi:hypothetical protein
LETLILVWVTCWIRIVGEYFNHPGYRFVLVEMFRLTHFWSSRFFLRSLNVPHFYFKVVERLLPQVFQFSLLELLSSFDQMIFLFVTNTIWRQKNKKTIVSPRKLGLLFTESTLRIRVSHFVNSLKDSPFGDVR